jgi:hypothetical protein
MLHAVTAWLILMLVAILNGTLREFVITPRTGPAIGHVISTLLLAALILAITWLLIPWIGPASSGDAGVIGLTWLGLTLLFEFGFGRLRGKPWAVLLADYNVARGRIWILVLLTTVAAPWLAARLRGTC